MDFSDILIRTLVMIPVFVINGLVAIQTYKWNQDRKGRKFLYQLRMKYKGAAIQLITVESSDSAALAQIKRELETASWSSIPEEGR